MNYLVIFFVISALGMLTIRSAFRGAFPTKSRVESLLKQAAHEIAAGCFGAAKRQLKPLVRRNVGGVRTQVLYAQALCGFCQPERALAHIDDALVMYPESLDLVLQKGKAYLESGNASEALRCFSVCRPIIHGEEDFLDLASALLGLGYVAEAQETIAPFVSRSRNGRLQALAGDCHFRSKRHRQALIYYLRAQHLGWKTGAMHTRLALCFLHLGKLDAAERFFHQLLVRDPSDVALTLALGATLEAKGEWRKALIVYQSGGAWMRCDGRIFRQAGICAILTEQYRFAEMYLNAAIQYGERSAKTLASLAYCLERQRRWSDAEAVYLHLIDEHPEHLCGYRGLAWVFGVGLSTHIDAEMGLAMARKAVQLTPDHISWELLSACEARAGNFAQAHRIQEQLSGRSSDEKARRRRQGAMRALREGRPLTEELLTASLVA